MWHYVQWDIVCVDTGPREPGRGNRSITKSYTDSTKTRVREALLKRIREIDGT